MQVVGLEVCRTGESVSLPKQQAATPMIGLWVFGSCRYSRLSIRDGPSVINMQVNLTLKAPVRTAADDCLEYFFNVFQIK